MIQGALKLKVSPISLSTCEQAEDWAELFLRDMMILK